LKEDEGAFEALSTAWELALGALRVYEEKKAKEKGQKDHERSKLLENVKIARAKMDAYNRYTVNVRGASPKAYGSLKEANIVAQFATLIRVTMPSPTAQEAILKHMRPLERLGEGSAYTAWMTDYGEEDATDNSSGDSGDDKGADSMNAEATLEEGNEMDYD
jgi:hypothetical protein